MTSTSTPAFRATKLLLAGLLLTATLSAGAPQQLSLLDVAADPPLGPNPYLAFLPHDAQPDWQRWQAYMLVEARARAEALPTRGAGVLFTESEPPDTSGLNDLPELAEPVPGFGTRPGELTTAQISGQLRDPPLVLTPSTEPDDTLNQALPFTLMPGTEVALSGTIGDGPWGSGGAGTGESGGDFDFYRFDAAAGQVLQAAVRTPEQLGALDPILGLYDGAGNILSFNDHLPQSGFLTTFDSFLTFTFDADGTYYLAVGGHSALDPDQEDEEMLPASPQIAGSGPGAQSEGEYVLRLALDLADRRDLDVFTLALRAGDVLGVNLVGGARDMLLRDPEGTERIGVRGRDPSGLFPETSPLPGGGEAAFALVIDQDGDWTLETRRAAFFDGGAYTLEASLFRNPYEFENSRRQILFLDFDGATFDPIIFGSDDGPVTLSPLSAFLPAWGFGGQEDAMIDAVLAVVEDKISQDVRARGHNGDFAATGHFGEFEIEIRNSRDHADAFGDPDVSRIILGGTQDELGILTIGLAESIDPGNFAREETAVVLLDLLSAGPSVTDSLRAVPRARGTTLFELVANALGTIAAHEAGHFFSNFHTARADEGPPALPTVMDRGGLIALYLGAGEDGIYGSQDDLDPHFGPDRYSPRELFTGIQNTLQALSFALPAGGPHAALTVAPSRLDFGAIEPGLSASLDARVGNAGTLDLTLDAADLRGDRDAFSLLAGSGPAVLSPGASRTLTARFAPLELGPREAVVEIPADDPRRALGLVSLTGQGGVPQISLDCGGDCAAIDFGVLIYDDQTKALRHTVTVHNLGTGNLTLNAVFTGRDREAFGVDAPTDRTLAPGEQTDLDLYFAPQGAVGELEGRLRLPSNDPAAPVLDILLFGFAVGPDLDLDPPSPFFLANEELGMSTTRTFALRNLGNSLLRVTQTRLTGEHAEEMEILQGAPADVPPGEAADLTVRFTPQSVGSKRAAIEIRSNDPDDSRLWFFLSGDGIASSILADPPVLHFGHLDIGEQAVIRLRVRNEGEAPLRVSESPILGADVDAFTILSGGAPFAITTAARRIDIAFTPTATGPHSAYLRLVSNDPENPELLVPLLGDAGDLVDIPTLSPSGLVLLAGWLFGAAFLVFRKRSHQRG